MIVDLADLLGFAVHVDGDDALCEDVGQPQAAIVPAWALAERQVGVDELSAHGSSRCSRSAPSVAETTPAGPVR